MAITAKDVKITRHKFEDEIIEAEYDVVYDGQVIGTVRRNDGTPNGYWGRWGAGRYHTDTRRDAVAYVIDRFNKKQED